MNELLWVKIAAVLWIFQLQYFLVQIVVARSWHQAYSLPKNFISDLGNSDMSPLYGLMNLSFILLGISIAAGAVFLAGRNVGNTGAVVGFLLLALGGLGTIVVGLFPENSISALHVGGAALPFILGNIGLVILAATLPASTPSWLRLSASVFGVTALVGLGLLTTKYYPLIGRGNMERIVAYPQTIWMILYGLWLLRF